MHLYIYRYVTTQSGASPFYSPHPKGGVLVFSAHFRSFSRRSLSPHSHTHIHTHPSLTHSLTHSHTLTHSLTHAHTPPTGFVDQVVMHLAHHPDLHPTGIHTSHTHTHTHTHTHSQSFNTRTRSPLRIKRFSDNVFEFYSR